MSVLVAGSMVGGSLRIEREIGRGAMGIVYEATDTSLRRSVAVKVLHREAASDPQLRARFAREARALARLSNEHVVRVFAVGDLPDGMPYVVMEKLEGRSLEARLEQGPIPTSEVLDYAKQALEALASAHAVGLIHRDVKPANLFLAERRNRVPIVKVLDFGIAKELARTEHLTATGEAIGSPAYMSPEQIAGKRELDARSDVWSFGVTLYELLTGRLPFKGNTIAAMLSKILNATPAPTGLTKPLDAIVMRCLEKDPERRYASAGELLTDIEALRAVSRGPRSALVFWVSLSAVLLAAVAGWVVFALLARGKSTTPTLPPEALSNTTVLPSEIPAPASPAPATMPSASATSSARTVVHTSASASTRPHPIPQIEADAKWMKEWATLHRAELLRCVGDFDERRQGWIPSPLRPGQTCYGGGKGKPVSETAIACMGRIPAPQCDGGPDCESCQTLTFVP